MNEFNKKIEEAKKEKENLEAKNAEENMKIGEEKIN